MSAVAAPARASFFFEFASTYSYPAAMRIESLAADAGVTLEWVPFLLGPLFQAQGWNDSPFNLYPAKGRYMWQDLPRLCAKLGVPYRRPSAFPRNGLTAARVACAAPNEPWLPAYVRAVYTANFAEDRDIADRTVIADCLAGAGAPDPDALLARAAEADVKQALRANTERAQALDIFGAPTLVVGDALYWGNERVEDALAAARSAAHDGVT